MFVNHLLFRKRKQGLFWKERQRTVCRKGTRKLPITSIQISAPAFPSTQTTASSTATAQSPKGTRESPATIKGALQLKVEFLFVKLPDYFILKIWQNAKNIFYNMNLSFFSELQKTKPKQRLCLVLPGYMQKVKRSLDHYLKKTVAKFSSRSKRFAKLAEEFNICIALENERNIKKLLVRTRIV